MCVRECVYTHTLAFWDRVSLYHTPPGLSRTYEAGGLLKSMNLRPAWQHPEILSYSPVSSLSGCACCLVYLCSQPFLPLCMQRRLLDQPCCILLLLFIPNPTSFSPFFLFFLALPPFSAPPPPRPVNLFWTTPCSMPGRSWHGSQPEALTFGVWV